jgi:hypothetical protein
MKINILYIFILPLLLSSFSQIQNTQLLDISTKQGRIYINKNLLPLETTKTILDSSIGVEGVWKKGKKIKGLVSKIYGGDYVKYDDFGIYATKSYEKDILASISIRFSKESAYKYGKEKLKTKEVFQGNLAIEDIILNVSTTLDKLKNTPNCRIESSLINGTAISHTLIKSNTRVLMHFGPKSGQLIDASVMLFSNNK